MKSQDIPSAEVAIIGLGYVGLPLFALFSKRYKCVGVDVDQQKIEHINKEYAYVSKSNNNLLPSPFFTTLGAGQPIFISIISAYFDIYSAAYPIDCTSLPNI